MPMPPEHRRRSTEHSGRQGLETSAPAPRSGVSSSSTNGREAFPFIPSPGFRYTTLRSQDGTSGEERRGEEGRGYDKTGVGTCNAEPNNAFNGVKMGRYTCGML